MEEIAAFASSTAWLPDEAFAADEQPLLKEFRSISNDTAGARAATTRDAREHQLQEQVKRLREQRTLLSRSTQARGRGYAETLAQWQQILEDAAERVAHERTTLGELPLRYVAGKVLETGAASFYGRSDLFRTLEELLHSSGGMITPVLLGQPRTGKTSTLKQFSQRLGAQVLPVYLDMERHGNAETPQGFVSDLAKAIQSAADSHPHPIRLPEPDFAALAADPYRLFENWIAEVEQAIGAQRLLILTLDEFDRLDRAVQAGRMDERIFFMLRSLI